MHHVLGDEVRRAGHQRLQLLVGLILAHFHGDVIVGAGVHGHASPRIGERDDRRFRVILDLDQRGGILGDGAAVGDHQRYRLAHIGYPAIGQRRGGHLHRHEEEAEHLELDAGEIGLRVNRVDAGNLARGLAVDRADRATGNCAAGEGDMQHAGQGDIVDKLAAPGEQARVFLAGHALADIARRARALGERRSGGVHAVSPA